MILHLQGHNHERAGLRHLHHYTVALFLGQYVLGQAAIFAGGIDLEKAAERNFINLSEAFARLARTNFYIAPEVLQQALQRDAANRRK